MNDKKNIPLLASVMTPKAAESLFYTFYTYDCSAVEVEGLLDEIGYHTLTVELFAKTLETHFGKLSVAELLRKVQQKELCDPSLKRRLETEHHPKETEVYMHLMLAFDCAELTVNERALLGQLALLPLDPYTIKDHLAPWLGSVNPDELGELIQTIRELVKKGWLEQTNHTYNLHPLIQQVISYQIPFDWELTKTLVANVTRLLLVVDKPNILDVYPLWKYGEYLRITIPTQYEETPEISKLKNNIALVYKDLGRYEEAAGLLEQALTSCQLYFSDSHPNVAATRSNLALVYRDLGRYDEAVVLFKQALSVFQSYLGDSHQSVATCRSNLALVYLDLDRYEEASRHLEQALKSEQVQFGDSHPDVATSRSNLALVYLNLGRYKEAAGLLAQVLSSRRAHFGDSHPSVVTSRSQLALAYRALGFDEGAAKFLV